jgi:RpiB/LacA/LacB family sugar-phosphate isomerase
MRIAVAADHAGFSLKQRTLAFLRDSGHAAEDLGTHNSSPVDYPDFAEAVAVAVLTGRVERAVLICGSGVGASAAANKFRGIRAGLCHDTYSAHQGVEHDHMNVLVLGGRVIGEALADELVGAFINAKQSQEERHIRRIAKMLAIEEKCGVDGLTGQSKPATSGI